MSRRAMVVTWVASALVGALVGAGGVAVAVGDGPRGPAGAQGARGPAGPPGAAAPRLSGYYVLIEDGTRCPRGSVAVNAHLRASTNSESGTSPFRFCWVGGS